MCICVSSCSSQRKSDYVTLITEKSYGHLATVCIRDVTRDVARYDLRQEKTKFPTAEPATTDKTSETLNVITMSMST